MIEQFGRAGFLLIFAVIFPLIPIVASVVLGVFKLRPKKPDPVKGSVYECGMVPIGTAQVRYKVRYYLFGLLFVVFDVEAVFLYPWAVSFGAIGFSAYLVGLIFIAILLVGYVYDWRKRAMEWM